MKWFAAQIDRNFDTGLYGDGSELFIQESIDSNNIIIKRGVIKSADYNVEKNTMVVHIKYPDDSNLHEIKLENEPDNNLFESTLYSDWKLWDEKYGEYDDDRSDYEPWAYDSIKSLAIEVAKHDVDITEKIKLYWNKSFTTNA